MEGRIKIVLFKIRKIIVVSLLVVGTLNLIFIFSDMPIDILGLMIFLFSAFFVTEASIVRKEAKDPKYVVIIYYSLAIIFLLLGLWHVSISFQEYRLSFLIGVTKDSRHFF